MSITHKQLKMADVTDTCMRHTVVVEILTANKISHTEIHRCLKSVYGEHTVDVSTVRCWFRLFKIGGTAFRDKPQSSRGATEVTADNKGTTIN